MKLPPTDRDISDVDGVSPVQSLAWICVVLSLHTGGMCSCHTQIRGILDTFPTTVLLAAQCSLSCLVVCSQRVQEQGLSRTRAGTDEMPR